MAVVKAPFLSIEAHGSVGKVLTARLVGNRQVMSRFQNYRYTRTSAQGQRRDWFKALVKTNLLFNNDQGFENITEIRPSEIITDVGIPIRLHMSCGFPTGLDSFWSGTGKLLVVKGTWGLVGRHLMPWECKAM